MYTVVMWQDEGRSLGECQPVTSMSVYRASDNRSPRGGHSLNCGVASKTAHSHMRSCASYLPASIPVRLCSLTYLSQTAQCGQQVQKQEWDPTAKLRETFIDLKANIPFFNNLFMFEKRHTYIHTQRSIYMYKCIHKCKHKCIYTQIFIHCDKMWWIHDYCF